MMSRSLKKKTIAGLKWTAVEKVGGQVVRFALLIILTRLLLPEDFGLIAIVMFFLLLGETIINAGFAQAYIQKKDVSEQDLCAVLTLGFLAACSFYVLIFILAPFFAAYYGEDSLALLLRVMMVGVFIDSIVIAQRSFFERNLKFGDIALASLPALVVSGVIAVICAFLGAGVWTFVFQVLSQKIICAIILWRKSSWRPRGLGFEVAMGLFNFGWKLQLAAMLNISSKNVASLILGGAGHSMATVGLYYRANSLQHLIVQTLIGVVEKVTFPVFSSIQDQRSKLYDWNRIVTRFFAFAIVPLVIAVFVYSEVLVGLVFGEAWTEMAGYLRLLVPIGIARVLISSNLTMLKVRGRTDLIVALRLIEACVMLGLLFLTISYGVQEMILGQVAAVYMSYLVIALTSQRITGYNIFEQIYDIIPYLLVGLISALVSFALMNSLGLEGGWELVGVCFFMVAYLICTRLFKLKVYVVLCGYLEKR